MYNKHSKTFALSAINYSLSQQCFHVNINSVVSASNQLNIKINKVRSYVRFVEEFVIMHLWMSKDNLMWYKL
jgi:hypothetical protein